MNLFQKSAPILCLFALAGLLSACSSDRGKLTPTEFCQNKYNKAEELFKQQKYGRAQDKLEEILSLCSGTGVMAESQFLLAESYFNLEEWIEARGEYGSFILNFPGLSTKVEIAQFRKAIASFNIEFKVARDDYNTTTAMKDFELYLSNYPDTPLRDSVNYYRGLLTERLAEKEFQTARLYYRMDKYQAAVIYLKEFLETYKVSKRRKDAFKIIVDSYIELDQFEPARNYLTMMRGEFANDDDIEKIVKKNEKNIASAEKDFEKRMKKDSKKKKEDKEDKEMTD
ncbi:MAG: outer membrane protein assembly factor BamD [Fibrobacter sp.]|nr:outer membrane protein assembly factor BamD [Fibrobacter sp.]